VSRRFAVLADLEGAAGVRSPNECYPNFPEFRSYGVPNMAADANAAALGLFQGGADEVVLVDGHLLGQNLISASLEGQATLSKGTLVDELKAGNLSGVFLTGVHGKAGTPNSFSSSTIAPFVAARLNGDIVGDCLLVAYLCGAFGVPLVAVSGDWVACEELQWALHGLPAAPTKTGFDRASVRHHDPVVSRQGITQAGERAAKAPDARTLKAPRAIRLELSFADEQDARVAADAVDGAARLQRRVLSFAGADFDETMAGISRAVGSLYPGWVDGLGRRAVPAEPSGRTAGGLLDPQVIARFYGPSIAYWSD
jgi:D-amino peptidase